MTTPHPLAESDRPTKDDATAPEAAAFIANPSAPQGKPTPEQLWLAEDAQWFGEIERGEVFTADTDAPLCTNCGNLTLRSGSCHTCPTCGTSSGCA